MWEPQAPTLSRSHWRGALLNLLLALFLLGSLPFGYFFYTGVRDIVAYTDLPFLAGVPAVVAGGLRQEPGGSSNPLPVSDHQLTGRVNILLLGIDRRDNDAGPWRSDTMILFSLDPATQSVSMLSIPRDLWVPLPKFSPEQVEDRINTANFYGDLEKYPGGGPALAKETIALNLGIRVHYYVRIDFRGFVRIIDEIDGIDIDVPKDIIDEEYPTPDGGTIRLYVQAGRQHMDGEMALKYARTRHADSDFGRARRQQQVILAVRDKVLSLNYSLMRIPGMLVTLGDTLKTDMTLDEIYAIGRAALQVRGDSIEAGVIDETMTTEVFTPGGADVLLPHRDQIRELVSRLFPVVPTAPALGPLGDAARLQQEAARIEVQNGTESAGLASKVAGELRAGGYNVVHYGNAARTDYAETFIICYVDRRYTLESLKARYGVPDARVVHQTAPVGNDVEICLVLGNDRTTR